MFRELTPVVRRYRLERIPFVRQKQPPDRPGQWPGFLSMPEFLHQHEVGTPLHKREYGIAIPVHYQVHLPVSETPAVSLHRTAVYAHTVLYVGGFGLTPVWGGTLIFHLMTTVASQSSRMVITEEAVYRLMRDFYSFKGKTAGDLTGRPLLGSYQLDYSPSTPSSLRLPGVRLFLSSDRSWALHHTHLPFGVELRLSSRLTVDLSTPMELAIISRVSFFCFPR